MDTSLGALRARLFNFRAWDSTGTTLDKRIREAMNTALERIAGDVPEAVEPDDEHVVLQKDAVGTAGDVLARVRTTTDTKVLEFTDASNNPLTGTSPWVPDTTGTYDGIMHLELTDSKGERHRRQCREFWIGKSQNIDHYYVTIDRPWETGTDVGMTFRLYQPEFFVTDDVTRVLEPARIYDETRQQVWAIDTGGAARQDMIDWNGENLARPYRFWRGRHFQMPAPTTAPTIVSLKGNPGTPWVGPEWEGSFQICYTYVWGRKDLEWQSAPGGIRDPQWESAPSPLSTYTIGSTNRGGAFSMTGTNIDAMMGFGDTTTLRYSRSGLRLRFYIARTSVDTVNTYTSGFNRVETDGKFYLLAEVEPVSGTYVWDGSAVPDYERQLKHSTGYYAYQVFPHQDNRYQLDFRVQRLPKALINDQDTAPIQRDAVMAYIELSLYYMCLLDGVDQSGSNLHLQRYNDLARHFRKRYANPGGVVEPVPITGYQIRFRYGTFRNGT